MCFVIFRSMQQQTFGHHLHPTTHILMWRKIYTCFYSHIQIPSFPKNYTKFKYGFVRRWSWSFLKRVKSTKRKHKNSYHKLKAYTQQKICKLDLDRTIWKENIPIYLGNCTAMAGATKSRGVKSKERESKTRRLTRTAFFFFFFCVDETGTVLVVEFGER